MLFIYFGWQIEISDPLCTGGHKKNCKRKIKIKGKKNFKDRIKKTNVILPIHS